MGLYDVIELRLGPYTLSLQTKYRLTHHGGTVYTAALGDIVKRFAGRTVKLLIEVYVPLSVSQAGADLPSYSDAFMRRLLPGDEVVPGVFVGDGPPLDVSVEGVEVFTTRKVPVDVDPQTFNGVWRTLDRPDYVERIHPIRDYWRDEVIGVDFSFTPGSEPGIPEIESVLGGKRRSVWDALPGLVSAAEEIVRVLAMRL